MQAIQHRLEPAGGDFGARRIMAALRGLLHAEKAEQGAVGLRQGNERSAQRMTVLHRVRHVARLAGLQPGADRGRDDGRLQVAVFTLRAQLSVQQTNAGDVFEQPFRQLDIGLEKRWGRTCG